MAKLTSSERAKIPTSKFAVPGGVKGHKGPSFPLDTKGRQEAAVKLAPVSKNAGNISTSTEKRIVREAKSDLGKKTPTSAKAPSSRSNNLGHYLHPKKGK